MLKVLELAKGRAREVRVAEVSLEAVKEGGEVGEQGGFRGFDANVPSAWYLAEMGSHKDNALLVVGDGGAVHGETVADCFNEAGNVFGFSLEVVDRLERD